MAKFGRIGLALLLSFLLATIFSAEATPTPNVARQPLCSAIHGVEQGETCTSIIAQHSKLDTPHFLQVNPNIDCEHIFVGQCGLCCWHSDLKKPEKKLSILLGNKDANNNTL